MGDIPSYVIDFNVITCLAIIWKSLSPSELDAVVKAIILKVE